MSQTLMAAVLSLGPALVTAGVALLAWRRRAVPSARAYALMLVVELAYMTLYAVELWAPELADKVLIDHLEYVALLVTAPLYLSFARVFAARARRPPAAATALVVAIPVLLSLALLLDPFDLRAGAALVPALPADALVYPFTWVDWLGYAYIYGTMLYAIAVILRHGAHAGRLARTQSRVVALGVALPLLGGVITMLGGSLAGHRDFAPYAFTVGHVVVVWGLLRRRLFSVIPVARRAVVEHMTDPVLVLDERGHLLDYNPAAESLLATAEPGAPAALPAPLAPWTTGAGAPSDDVAIAGPSGSRWYHVVATPLRHGSSVIGRVLLLRDVT